MRGALVAAILVIGIACGRGSAGTNDLYPQKDEPANLAGLLDTIARAAESGDAKKAGALTRGLIPGQAACKQALRPDVPPALLAALVDRLKVLPADDATLGRLIHRGDPTQTRVNVHGATPEEIAAGATPASGEFPPDAKAKAGLLRPGLRFYEAEFVAPGEDFGMKYHLFFWDGDRWRMLGPIWQVLD